MVEHLTTLLDRATVVPAVNQIECHPYFTQQDFQEFGAEHGILTQARSPIGRITFYRDGSHGSTLDDPLIGCIARAHEKTPAHLWSRDPRGLRAVALQPKAVRHDLGVTRPKEALPDATLTASSCSEM
jgi:hypothetical protein